MENEKYLNDGSRLCLYDNSILKKQMLSELENFYEYINSTNYKLNRLKKGFFNFDLSEEEISKLLSMIDNDDTIKISDYENLKNMILNMRIKKKML